MDKNVVLKKWLQEGILKDCPSSELRLAEEHRSLQKLKQRKGFLAEYDSAIRYMYLYLLENKCDIKISSVHRVFKLFLQEFIQLTPLESNRIISTRHMLKYHQNNVPLDTLETFENVKLRMIEILKTS